MVELDEHGRPEPEPAVSEIDTLLGFLDYQRATLAWKCAGLDEAGLRAKVGASSMTLGGLLKHMALVEEIWFSHRLNGNALGAPWDAVDWTAQPDWEWESSTRDSPDELRAQWEDATKRSRELVTEALATDGLGQLVKAARPSGMAPSLRWILVHMIEEYARHNGHADLLRESVDGETGE
jgi:uncharacterized damage-inducible protein DinB